MERLWSRRAELFGDIRSGAALHNAMVDRIRVPGEGNEWVNMDLTREMCDLVYDPFAPGGIRSPATVSDEAIAAAGISREVLEYWVASERIAIVDNGGALPHELVPLHRYPAPPQPRARLRRRVGAARARATRRRARRVARAPDDRPRLGDSRPRPPARRRRSMRVGRAA